MHTNFRDLTKDQRRIIRAAVEHSRSGIYEREALWGGPSSKQKLLFRGTEGTEHGIIENVLRSDLAALERTEYCATVQPKGTVVLVTVLQKAFEQYDRRGSVPELGDVIDDTFRVLEKLGSGAAGIVFRVSLDIPWKSMCAGHELCLKWYKDEIFERENEAVVISRRLREASAGIQLDCPNIVKMFDTSEYWQDEVPQYLVMEYIDGEGLNDDLDNRAPLPEKEIRKMLFQLATGIKALHQGNYIHRDIKAANVRLRSDGSPVLLDLGVVRPTAEPRISESQTFLGTLRYSAPEWLLAEQCSESSDIYSLGAIAYNMLTGNEVFEDISLYTRLVVAIKESIPEIDSLSRKKAGFMASHIDRMLSKAQSQRPTIDEVIAMCQDSKSFDAWNGLQSSGFIEKMPESVRNSEARIHKIVEVIASSTDISELLQIMSSGNYSAFILNWEIASLVYIKSATELFEECERQPNEKRADWIRKQLANIDTDSRMGLGQQIELRESFVGILETELENQRLLSELSGDFEEVHHDWKMMWQDLAQENPGQLLD